MKETIASTIIVLGIVGAAFVFTRGGREVVTDTPINNTTIVDGVQIVDITAKGGYLPRKSIAKAGIPTIARFSTSGTFDCSSALRIPSMDISKNLPSSGVTDIDLGIPELGTLEGSCGMGMYPFEIEFQ